MPSTESPIWLVTGCSSGIGRDLVLQALKRGQKVIATGRNVSRLEGLANQGADVVQLNPNSSPKELQSFADSIIEKYGHVDVLVNNAGYLQHGIIEETSFEQLEEQMRTNVYAPINLTKAFLPSMRKKRSGTIIMIGSIVAYRYAPVMGLYDASKAALKALTDVLGMEVKSLGIRVCHIEPGLFRTNVFDPLDEPEKEDHRISDYDQIRKDGLHAFLSRPNNGDPLKLGNLIIDVVLGQGLATGKEFPSALTVGKGALEGMELVVNGIKKRIEEWRTASESTEIASP